MANMSTSCDTQSNLLPLDSAIEQLLSKAKPVQQTEVVSLQESLGRILAESITSQATVPPHDNSAVDGYALKLSDFKAGQSLPISARIPAGTHPAPLAPGSAARIFTGATIPNGADCVVMQENCEAGEGEVLIRKTPELHQNIRPAGQDFEKGQTLIEGGTSLNPQHIGLIASAGVSNLSVFKPVSVAILSTGDELVEPGTPLQPSQIYNSNRYLLTGLLNSFGFNVIDTGIVEDKLDTTIDALRKAAESADVVITTGGASVGEEDHIQNAIKALGTIDFWRIAIKPGKPFMFGEINQTPVLGLPGNPGAVFVTFLMLARPFLLTTQGHSAPVAKPLSATLGFDIPKPAKRREFMRVQYDAGTVNKHTNQSSGMLSSATWAEGLAVIPENTELSKGSPVSYYPFPVLLGY